MSKARPRRFSSSLATLFTGLLLLAGVTTTAGADELRIAVASNFRPAMEDAATRFEQAAGEEVTLIFGSTGKHYAQIVNGAPFDAFFAADAERPRRLEREGRIVPDSRFTYAVGRIVLWSADARLVDPAGRVLETAGFRHLAIGNPDLAPYGEAARALMRSLGLWEELQPKLVRGENIAQTFQFVISGNAELGFVARSQLLAPGRSFGGSAWEPPQSLYPPIAQQAVLLRDSPAGRNFMAFMQGDAAAAILRAYGYDSAPLTGN